MRIFDHNGPLMIALGKLADIVICNLMFCLFCLPVITVGASLTALFTCMQELVYDEEKDDGLIFRDFWVAFRRNFGQATLLWLFCLLVLAFLGAYYWVVRSMAAGYARVYMVTFYVLLLVFLFGALYLFPLQARYENTVKNTIRNAWLLSVGALPWTLLSILLIAAAVYISFFMNPAAVDVFTYLWAVCGFALVAYLDSFFFRKAFLKFGPEMLRRKSGERAEGAIFTDEEHQEQDLMVQESRFSDPNWNRREDILGEDKPKQTGKRRRRR
ncbi:MAG: DUF624 domain-containing protein [Oscillospiraceae bacterium]|nr:DUF624 domain-containing protein [Oscillospiraceae bacterium]